MIDLIGMRPDFKALAYTDAGHAMAGARHLDSVIETPPAASSCYPWTPKPSIASQPGTVLL